MALSGRADDNDGSRKLPRNMPTTRLRDPHTLLIATSFLRSGSDITLGLCIETLWTASPLQARTTDQNRLRERRSWVLDKRAQCGRNYKMSSQIRTHRRGSSLATFRAVRRVDRARRPAGSERRRRRQPRGSSRGTRECRGRSRLARRGRAAWRKGEGAPNMEEKAMRAVGVSRRRATKSLRSSK